jgi:hypothetical protein
MTIKEISRNKPKHVQPRDRKDTLGLGPAILGLVCVASVFAVLAALYTVG